ncbi:hypothetical protein CHS0354_026328 [Potamilus streckersoni]|uniref:Uncharacterized protein n=1 Tax=Potamilus streckersoni TaxID=2493646 RepID=A0AAE0T2T3_9BIVA|nr:hypothetical protein CHS0354_026328 [Potamilus streckersoni]
MSKESLTKLISLDNVCTFKAEIVVRLKLNNKQKEVMLAQHSDYSKTHNLTFLLNEHQGFNAPKTNTTPYFYLGFLPQSTARSKTIQGYRANDKDFSFPNCDANLNSYIAFYTGEQNINHTISQSDFMMGWINQAKLIPAERYLPDDYFMKFEMHMGGCGGLMSYSNNTAAVGCVIGMF